MDNDDDARRAWSARHAKYRMTLAWHTMISYLCSGTDDAHVLTAVVAWCAWNVAGAADCRCRYIHRHAGAHGLLHGHRWYR